MNKKITYYNVNKIHKINERIKKMGYENIMYYDNDILNEIYIYPKLDFKHIGFSKGFIIYDDIIDYLNSLGFKIEYAIFFGNDVGMWFKRKEGE